MSEGSESWRPQGQGPHTTLGGNLFDPNVGADGMKNSTGGGVGGTSERNVMEEGAEHIRQRNGGSDQTGYSGADQTGYSGADQTTGTNTSSTGGGVTGYLKSALGYNTTSNTSGTAAGEPSMTEQHDDGIDYIKSRSGTGAETGATAGGLAGGE